MAYFLFAALVWAATLGSIAFPHIREASRAKKLGRIQIGRPFSRTIYRAAEPIAFAKAVRAEMGAGLFFAALAIGTPVVGIAQLFYAAFYP